MSNKWIAQNKILSILEEQNPLVFQLAQLVEVSEQAPTTGVTVVAVVVVQRLQVLQVVIAIFWYFNHVQIKLPLAVCLKFKKLKKFYEWILHSHSRKFEGTCYYRCSYRQNSRLPHRYNHMKFFIYIFTGD